MKMERTYRALGRHCGGHRPHRPRAAGRTRFLEDCQSRARRSARQGTGRDAAAGRGGHGGAVRHRTAEDASGGLGEGERRRPWQGRFTESRAGGRRRGDRLAISRRAQVTPGFNAPSSTAPRGRRPPAIAARPLGDATNGYAECESPRRQPHAASMARVVADAPKAPRRSVNLARPCQSVGGRKSSADV